MGPASGCSILKLVNTLLLVAIGFVLVYQVMITTERPHKDRQEPLKSGGRRKRSVQQKEYAGGVVYTQWGRQNCTGTDAQTVYSGVAAGSYYSHSGGGSNYLCMPLNPTYANFNPAQANRSMLFGAEYEIAGHRNFPFHGQHEKIHDHNVPCVVCQVIARSMHIMIPARSDCVGTWTKEYHGYLMSEYYNHKGRTEFVCVDSDPDVDPAGYRNENGALFHTTEGVCGSLPCPPYANGKELTCVVCTK